jgi:hypothetical protein
MTWRGVVKITGVIKYLPGRSGKPNFITWYIIASHEEPIYSVNIGADTLEEAKRKNPVNYFFGRWKKDKWFWEKTGWKVRCKINLFILKVKNILGAKSRAVEPMCYKEEDYE